MTPMTLFLHDFHVVRPLFWPPPLHRKPTKCFQGGVSLPFIGSRVMQDHEARANDLNRKLIFSFFFAIFLIKATET